MSVLRVALAVKIVVKEFLESVFAAALVGGVIWAIFKYPIPSWSFVGIAVVAGRVFYVYSHIHHSLPYSSKREQ